MHISLLGLPWCWTIKVRRARDPISTYKFLPCLCQALILLQTNVITEVVQSAQWRQVLVQEETTRCSLRGRHLLCPPPKFLCCFHVLRFRTQETARQDPLIALLDPLARNPVRWAFGIHWQVELSLLHLLPPRYLEQFRSYAASSSSLAASPIPLAQLHPAFC